MAGVTQVWLKCNLLVWGDCCVCMDGCPLPTWPFSKALCSGFSGAVTLVFFEEATSYFLCVASPSQRLLLTLLRALSLGCQHCHGLLYPNTLLDVWWLLFEALLSSGLCLVPTLIPDSGSHTSSIIRGQGVTHPPVCSYYLLCPLL